MPLAMWPAGMALYLKDGVPVFDYNYFEDHTVVQGKQPLPAGNATLTVDFTYGGSGVGMGGQSQPLCQRSDNR